MKILFNEGIQEDLDNIKKKYETLEIENQRLLKENKQLKSKHYKDEELIRLDEENKKLHKQLSLGFPVSQEEHDKIEEWAKNHDCIYNGTKLKGVSYYKFGVVPGIGYNGYVTCVCGKEFCFTGEL